MNKKINFKGEININKVFKIVTIISILIIVILIFYIICKKLIEPAVSKYQLNDQLSEEEKDLPIDKETGERQKPTLTESEAQKIANQMYNIMKGLTAGYNISGFSGQVKLIKNQADWILVQKKFGMRDGDNLKLWITDDNFDDDVQNYFASVGIQW